MVSLLKPVSRCLKLDSGGIRGRTARYKRPQAIAYQLDFVESHLIGFVSRIVGDAVAFVVETGGCFR